MKICLFFLLIHFYRTQFAAMMSAASGAMGGGGDAKKNPNKKSLTSHSGKFYTVKDIPTIEMPNFENKNKVAQDNWSNMFFMDMPVEDEQYAGQNSGYPNSYIQNTPLIYPNAYATGMYPPVILI